jgi:Predicted permease
MTSTATLQAALDVMHNSEPSIGYSVAYPFGVIGPILCFYFLTRRVKPEFPPKPAQFHMAEITLERLPEGGRSLGEIIRSLPAGVQVSRSARSIAIGSRTRTSSSISAMRC